MSDTNPSAPRVRVGTATARQLQESKAQCKIPLKGMPVNLFAHIIPGSQHSLLGIVIMCDKDYRILFTKRRVIIYNKHVKPFLTGRRELTGSKLWRASLCPELDAWRGVQASAPDAAWPGNNPAPPAHMRNILPSALEWDKCMERLLATQPALRVPSTVPNMLPLTLTAQPTPSAQPFAS